MKNKTVVALSAAVAVIVLCLTITLFIVNYRTVPGMENTKLQVVVFSHMEDSVICCDNGVSLDLDDKFNKVFDREGFLSAVSEGEQFFVRVSPKQLDDTVYTPYAIIGDGGEYLSLEQTIACYNESNATAAIGLAVGILVFVALAGISVFLFYHKD